MDQCIIVILSNAIEGHRGWTISMKKGRDCPAAKGQRSEKKLAIERAESEGGSDQGEGGSDQGEGGSDQGEGGSDQGEWSSDEVECGRCGEMGREDQVHYCDRCDDYVCDACLDKNYYSWGNSWCSRCEESLCDKHAPLFCDGYPDKSRKYCNMHICRECVADPSRALRKQCNCRMKNQKASAKQAAFLLLMIRNRAADPQHDNYMMKGLHALPRDVVRLIAKDLFKSLDWPIPRNARVCEICCKHKLQGR